VEGTAGAFHNALAVVAGGSSARWNVKIVIVRQLSHERRHGRAATPAYAATDRVG
jgi:hypothetical protein